MCKLGAPSMWYGAAACLVLKGIKAMCDMRPAVVRFPFSKGCFSQRHGDEIAYDWEPRYSLSHVAHSHACVHACVCPCPRVCVCVCVWSCMFVCRSKYFCFLLPLLVWIHNSLIVQLEVSAVLNSDYLHYCGELIGNCSHVIFNARCNARHVKWNV